MRATFSLVRSASSFTELNTSTMRYSYFTIQLDIVHSPEV